MAAARTKVLDALTANGAFSAMRSAARRAGNASPASVKELNSPASELPLH